jgi:hypothetical protein
MVSTVWNEPLHNTMLYTISTSIEYTAPEGMPPHASGVPLLKRLPRWRCGTQINIIISKPLVHSACYSGIGGKTIEAGSVGCSQRQWSWCSGRYYTGLFCDAMGCRLHTFDLYFGSSQGLFSLSRVFFYRHYFRRLLMYASFT